MTIKGLNAGMALQYRVGQRKSPLAADGAAPWRGAEVRPRAGKEFLVGGRRAKPAGHPPKTVRQGKINRVHSRAPVPFVTGRESLHPACEAPLLLVTRYNPRPFRPILLSSQLLNRYSLIVNRFGSPFGGSG